MIRGILVFLTVTIATVFLGHLLNNVIKGMVLDDIKILLYNLKEISKPFKKLGGWGWSKVHIYI